MLNLLVTFAVVFTALWFWPTELVTHYEMSHTYEATEYEFVLRKMPLCNAVTYRTKVTFPYERFGTAYLKQPAPLKYCQQVSK